MNKDTKGSKVVHLTQALSKSYKKHIYQNIQEIFKINIRQVYTSHFKELSISSTKDSSQ